MTLEMRQEELGTLVERHMILMGQIGSQQLIIIFMKSRAEIEQHGQTPWWSTGSNCKMKSS